jgi:hypothetical protein
LAQQIDREDFRLPSRDIDLTLHLGKPSDIPGYQQNCGSKYCQTLAYRLTDAAACSGYDCDLSCQFRHSFLTFCSMIFVAKRLICGGRSWVGIS